MCLGIVKVDFISMLLIDCGILARQFVHPTSRLDFHTQLLLALLINKVCNLRTVGDG